MALNELLKIFPSCSLFSKAWFQESMDYLWLLWQYSRLLLYTTCFLKEICFIATLKS